MKYVLDTNVLSALMQGDVDVVHRMQAVNSADVGVPQPALAEIAYGVQRLPASRRKQVLKERFELIRVELKSLAWSDVVSDAFGQIKSALEKSGQPLEDFDVAIAAHALAYDAVLVSGNRKHMSRIKGMRVEDWTTATP